MITMPTAIAIARKRAERGEAKPFVRYRNETGTRTISIRVQGGKVQCRSEQRTISLSTARRLLEVGQWKDVTYGD